jgi:hypothetical protein
MPKHNIADPATQLSEVGDQSKISAWIQQDEPPSSNNATPNRRVDIFLESETRLHAAKELFQTANKTGPWRILLRDGIYR